tara:strand:+ start:166 stop:540 length:375 start_codon:yes stop_codon:yes gene_type:complete
MKLKTFISVIILTGCSSMNAYQNHMTKKDIEGYAIASCFTYQESPYLKDQGDAWASVIVQRMKGSIDILPEIAEIIKDEVNKGEMVVVQSESINAQDKTLPVLYCNEIIYKPHVQSALKKLQTK